MASMSTMPEISASISGYTLENFQAVQYRVLSRVLPGSWEHLDSGLIWEVRNSVKKIEINVEG